MVDFHSHILPGIDDGSKNVEESIKMLQMMTEQGVKKVVATPHFDVNNTSVDEFLKNRFNSFSLLKEILPENSPEIVLGAEVSYYGGIEHLNNIESLCIQNTKLLLIEMPTTMWSRATLDSIVALSCKGEINVVIAHLERYYSLQNIEVWQQLLTNGVIMQSNASFFIDFFSRHKALKMLNNGYIHVIGSDSHNIDYRKPNIGEAYNIISKKFGKEFSERIISFSNGLLNNEIL